MRTAMVTVVMLLLCGVVLADFSRVTTGHKVETAVVASQLSGLESSVAVAADFSSVGDVDLLSNGMIIVKIPTRVYRDGSGDLVYTPKEVVAFQTNQAFNAEETTLRSILAFEEVAFEIQFNVAEENAVRTGVLTVTSSSGNLMQFDFSELLEGLTGATCSVTCGSGGTSSCSQTCPVNKACIAYCSGGIAKCDCVDEPRLTPALTHAK